MAYLKVKRTSMTPYRRGIIIGFTYTVEVLQAEGLPAEIFNFLRIPQPSVPGESDDQFQNVCSPADLAEYPVGGSEPGTNYPFFRLSEVTLRFRNESLAEDAWRCMQTDFQALVTAVEESAQLVVEEEVEYGTPPGSSSSPSSSQSSST